MQQAPSFDARELALWPKPPAAVHSSVAMTTAARAAKYKSDPPTSRRRWFAKTEKPERYRPKPKGQMTMTGWRLGTASIPRSHASDGYPTPV